MKLVPVLMDEESGMAVGLVVGKEQRALISVMENGAKVVVVVEGPMEERVLDESAVIRMGWAVDGSVRWEVVNQRVFM